MRVYVQQGLYIHRFDLTCGEKGPIKKQKEATTMSITRGGLCIVALFVAGLIPRHGFAQCQGSGQIIQRDVNCCGHVVSTHLCQGFTGQCDPLNTWKQCTSSCSVGNAGCGIEGPTGQPRAKAERRPLVEHSGRSQSEVRFVEAACGPKEGLRFNEWLAKKLKEKQRGLQQRLGGL